MTELDTDNSTFFDVDSTLVYWISKEEFIKNHEDYHKMIYGGEYCYFKQHNAHIRFLKHCHERGDTIVVWSQNGKKHATKVTKMLGLEKYVKYTMAKPTRHVDDKEDVASIVGNRIFIKE